MEIVILDTADGHIVGWEIQFGRREGQFVLNDDRFVVYRHPYDVRAWPAGTLAQFRRAASALLVAGCRSCPTVGWLEGGGVKRNLSHFSHLSHH